MIKDIIKKINNRSISICVIGLGYVGLPLLIRLAESKFKNLTGYDTNENKISLLKKSKSYINQIEDKQIKILNKIGVDFKSNITDGGKNYDIFIICLPTPINKKKNQICHQ